MSRGASAQRHEANIAALRGVVDTGSPCVVRDPVEGSKGAGARRVHPVPSIGYRSGKLTVTGYLRGERGGFRALIVQCDCRLDEYTVDTHNFKVFRTTRCPVCAKTAANRKRYWVYSAELPADDHRARLLNRLSSAISRCHNPTNRAYQHYGGRGIFVYRAWRDNRGLFLRYVQTLEGWDDPARDIDRVDNNAGYGPGNIRFSTRAENAANKRRVAELEARIRHLEQRLAEQVHDPD